MRGGICVFAKPKPSRQMEIQGLAASKAMIQGQECIQLSSDLVKEQAGL
jgi:hypothetical protein